MTQVHDIDKNRKEEIKERTPDQWDDVIAELKSRIKKLEEDMAYAMAKK